MRDCLHLEKPVYSETLCYPTPHVKSQLSEIKFSLWTHFFTSRTSFLTKMFLCVKIQYLSCIYLWGIVSILKNQFTVKHFVTLPPMWNLSCQKSSFDFGLIFSHLALLLLQKHFFGIKIQYLMSTYVWLILCKWVELPSGWVVPGSCVKIGKLLGKLEFLLPKLWEMTFLS